MIVLQNRWGYDKTAQISEALGHGRWGPRIKNCYITIQNPKSPKSGRKNLDFEFWIGEFWILDSGFWILGRSRGCTTRQFSDGALRSEAQIPPGPSLAVARLGYLCPVDLKD